MGIRQDCVFFNVRVKPAAKENVLRDVVGGFLKCSVKAVPEEGAANKALIELFAKILELKKQDITLVRGASSREKVLKVPKTNQVLSFIQEIKCQQQ